MANKLKVSPALVTELEKRVDMQFEQATLSDLLIPSYNKGETMYDDGLNLAYQVPSPGRGSS